MGWTLQANGAPRGAAGHGSVSPGLCSEAITGSCESRWGAGGLESRGCPAGWGKPATPWLLPSQGPAGGCSQGHAPERHRDLPCASPANSSAAHLVQRRRSKEGGVGRGGEGRQALRRCRAPRINRIKALENESFQIRCRRAAMARLPPAAHDRAARSPLNQASSGVPAPCGRRAGVPQPPRGQPG